MDFIEVAESFSDEDEELETIILRNTNREGRRVLGATFEDIDTPTLRAYIGLLILAGVYRSNNEATESLWDAEIGRPIFRAVMSNKTFKKISRFIRFDDRSTRSSRRETDKFAPIRELWDSWVDILPKLYNPQKNITIDEQLVPFRGRCPFRQYMPMKPAKYGMKNWVACDSGTSYVWNIQPYTGRINNTPERNQGMRVVQDLTAGLKGYNITVDNFFTSYELAQKLLKRGITSVGTIRKNKPSIPRVLLESKKWPAQSSKFAFTKDTTLVTYVPKKNRSVILQSTLHTTNSINNKENKKPLIIEDYNASKGANIPENQETVLETYKKSITSLLANVKWKMPLHQYYTKVISFICSMPMHYELLMKEIYKTLYK
ncbi:piggyBac transposable element-derived protein 4-like [Hermetia illucens]|uniref:piggyBac transposable element-derived protein 4-like n=1 Tax=Hermetia illucens TaxID=343691 RepID=UPI0018CBF655|nr:piggyBac transposable element-derived protein 4-like [Hermetia illucens]